MSADDRERRIYELNLRAAQTAHERFYAAATQLFQSVLGFADTALKGSAILNGGAAVATLAFIGALLTSQTTPLADYSPLIGILTASGLGVLLSTLAGGASYFAQMAYQNAFVQQELTWEHPFVIETPKFRSRNRWAIGVHAIAVILVVLSYSAFVSGGWQFRQFASEAFSETRALEPAPAAHPPSGRPPLHRDATDQESNMDGDSANLVVAVSAVAATLIGPLAAVLITLRWERVRRSREERQLILQTLLATRGRHADPGYSWAIRTTPLHFARNKDVLSAHASYMDAVRLEPAAENRERADAEIGRRQGILISEMLKDLGYRGLTAEQIESYTAQGLADREELLQKALQSLPHIAVSAKRSADAAEMMVKRMYGQE